MYKVLLAEDEPGIRAGIKHTIESFDLGLSVVSEANNGLKALEEARIHQPDIIITDIAMPRLNGLDFVKSLKEEGIASHVVIITGYDKFDYAKQAIDVGVASYLLKPVVEKELYQTLKSLVGELEESFRVSRFLSMAQRELQKNRKRLIADFFYEWTSGELSEEELTPQMEYLSIQFTERVCLYLIAAEYDPSLLPAYGKLSEQLTQYTVEGIFEEIFKKETPIVIYTDRFHFTVVVLPLSGEELSEEALTEQTERIRREFENITGGKTECRVEVSVCGQADFVNTYEELSTAIRQEASYQTVVREAREYIMQHYSENSLDLTGVARELGCNPAYLSRMMKQEMGLSFKEFLTNLRIHEACVFMQNPKLSLMQIAEKAGYSNQYYFSTAFKKQIGFSPKEYRKGLLNGGLNE